MYNSVGIIYLWSCSICTIFKCGIICCTIVIVCAILLYSCSSVGIGTILWYNMYSHTCGIICTILLHNMYNSVYSCGIICMVLGIICTFLW